MRLRLLFAGLGVMMVLILAPFVASAQTCGPPPLLPCPSPPSTILEVFDLVKRIAQWMLQFFWIAAVISGIYAAYLYLAGGSNPDNISKAHRQIVYTVVAIAAAIFAFVLPSILNSIIVVV